MLRFSLGTLLVFTSCFAIGCAALVCATDLWRQLIVTVVIMSLISATLLAIVTREQGKPFALGFALVGWIYLVLAFTPIVEVKDHLLTTRALSWLNAKLDRQAGVSAQVASDFDNDGWGDLIYFTSPANSSASQFQLVTGRPRTPVNFHVIGHSLWALILGCLGGWFVRFQTRIRKGDPTNRDSLARRD